MERRCKHRDFKLVKTERRRNYLVSEPNYHTKKNFSEKKRQILRNKPVHFGLLILELSKVLMYELWYDYIKPK